MIGLAELVHRAHVRATAAGIWNGAFFFRQCERALSVPLYLLPCPPLKTTYDQFALGMDKRGVFRLLDQTGNKVFREKNDERGCVIAAMSE